MPYLKDEIYAEVNQGQLKSSSQSQNIVPQRCLALQSHEILHSTGTVMLGYLTFKFQTLTLCTEPAPAYALRVSRTLCIDQIAPFSETEHISHYIIITHSRQSTQSLKKRLAKVFPLTSNRFPGHYYPMTQQVPVQKFILRN